MSAILIPSLVGILWLDSVLGEAGWLFMVLCLGVAGRSAWELCDLIRVRQLQPRAGLSITLSLLPILGVWGMHGFFTNAAAPPTPGLNEPVLAIASGQPTLAGVAGAACGLSIGLLVLLIEEARRFQEPGRSLESLSVHMLIMSYCGGLTAMAAQFRWLPSPETGFFAVASMIVAVKAGDTAAYFSGRLIGGRKMSPLLSPGKTRAGAVGAVVGSSCGAAAWLMYAGELFAAQPVCSSLVHALLYGGILGVIGLTGDLCESLLKRDAGKKDSAALMPGFGGLLDLLDSILFAAPVALLWWILVPPATVTG